MASVWCSTSPHVNNIWYSTSPDVNNICYVMGAKLPPGKYNNVICGFCSSIMDVQRNCVGILSYAAAKSAHKDTYDLFNCPFIDTAWHRQVVLLTKDINAQASPSVRDLMIKDRAVVLLTKMATIQV